MKGWLNSVLLLILIDGPEELAMAGLVLGRGVKRWLFPLHSVSVHPSFPWLPLFQVPGFL